LRPETLLLIREDYNDDSVLESLWNEQEQGDKERAKLCTKENGFSSSL
jgi:hypothetical protein